MEKSGKSNVHMLPQGLRTAEAGAILQSGRRTPPSARKVLQLLDVIVHLPLLLFEQVLDALRLRNNPADESTAVPGVFMERRLWRPTSNGRLENCSARGAFTRFQKTLTAASNQANTQPNMYFRARWHWESDPMIPPCFHAKSHRLLKQKLNNIQCNIANGELLKQPHLTSK